MPSPFWVYPGEQLALSEAPLLGQSAPVLPTPLVHVHMFSGLGHHWIAFARPAARPPARPSARLFVRPPVPTFYESILVLESAKGV